MFSSPYAHILIKGVICSTKMCPTLCIYRVQYDIEGDTVKKEDYKREIR